MSIFATHKTKTFIEMKRNIPSLIMIISIMISYLFIINIFPKSNALTKSSNKEKQEQEPNDWFFRQRAYPQGQVKYDGYQNAMIQAVNDRHNAAMRTKSINSLTWQFAGPNNIGGRVSCIAMHPNNMQVMYIGAATGGIFKSVDAGTTWNPIFDAQPNLSIGDIAIATTNPNILYVGTGEANCGGGGMTYDGMGVFKSIDAGATWTSVGLDSTRNTGRIAIDPTNANRVFVAAMGDLFGNTHQRGIYRTTDGGASWQQVLYISDSTGGIDLAINPQHPDTIFAAMWERIRKPDRENYGGNQCNIYRSVDGGNTWTILTNGLPANSAGIGRIGIGISQSNPNILFASYATNNGSFQGIYKTSNSGNSWTHLTGFVNMSSYGWWNGRITVDPVDTTKVYCVAFDLYKSTNSGSTFNSLSTNHVDEHAVFVHPLNTNLVLAANDGGLDISHDGGTTFTNVSTLPITQFYTCEIDNSNPTNLYGGAQDNGTNYTPNGNINNWSLVYGGDGFYCQIDPTNSANQYFEYQYGSTSFVGQLGTRQNWNTPFALDPIVPTTIYYGAEKVYKNSVAISPDLTNGPGSGNLVYGTITSLSISRANNSTIYAGTDDGNVWVTANGGGNWTNVTGTLPHRWITKVVADPVNVMVGYVTVSGYKYDEYLPHVFRTINRGTTWTDISGNLPQAPVSDVLIDPNNTNILYAATDVGVYYTSNLGNTWQLLASGIPIVPITMLKLHNPTRTLVAATYGRSMYKLNISTVTGNADMAMNDGASVSVYPNPVSDFVNVDFGNEVTDAGIRIFDVTGKEVMNRMNLSGRKFTMERGNLKAGIYLYDIQVNNKSIRKGKMLVE